MQTFLPFPCFAQSARCLTNDRVYNQVNEAVVIARTLLGLYPPTKTGRPGGWPYHPATRMWAGHTFALIDYAMVCYAESKRRGINVDPARFTELTDLQGVSVDTGMPHWFGDEAFHRSHRSNLIRKRPDVYRGQLGWSEPDDLPYVWPKPRTAEL